VTDSEKVSRSPIVVADPSDRRFPVFPPDVLEELFEFAERRELATGDVLYRAGQSNSEFFVLIDGEVEVVRDNESQELVVVYTPGQFIGEFGLVTGQNAFLTARSTESGMALVIPQDSFRRLVPTKPTISDDIFQALIARRETVRTTSAPQAIQIIGSRFSREALALRTFAARNRLAYTWIDLEEAEDVGVSHPGRGVYSEWPLNKFPVALPKARPGARIRRSTAAAPTNTAETTWPGAVASPHVVQRLQSRVASGVVWARRTALGGERFRSSWLLGFD
jgi:CRP-like cAMP-binding protein